MVSENSERLPRATRRRRHIRQSVAALRRLQRALLRPGPVAFGGWMAAVVLTGMAGALLISTTVQEQALRIRDLTVVNEDLEIYNHGLRAQLALREAPGALDAAAAELGLVPKSSVVYLDVETGQIHGTMVPAKARPRPVPHAARPTATGTATPTPAATRAATPKQNGSTPSSASATQRPGPTAAPSPSLSPRPTASPRPTESPRPSGSPRPTPTAAANPAGAGSSQQ